MHPVGKTKPDAMNGNNVVHMVSVIPLILVIRSASVEDVVSFRASDAAMMAPDVRHSSYQTKRVPVHGLRAWSQATMLHAPKHQGLLQDGW